MAEKTAKKKVEKKEKPKEAKEEKKKEVVEKEAPKKTEKPEAKEKAKETESKTYVIPLKKAFGSFRSKRAKHASKTLKEFLQRHIKKGEIKIDASVNDFLHSKGKCHIPRRIKVNAVKEGDKTTVKLAE
jgi:ribosomal protein L31E